MRIAYLMMFCTGILNHVDSLFRYHQKMNRSFGIDVIECHTFVVLVQQLRWDLFADDFIENRCT